ncbi:GSCFA domain-containing protein [Brevundimonas vesicularis]|uniref:GSCFA domain-containing protein n=1 Tax=Brevundimonas vesicularis TaxID=41276 RepID=UPI0022AC5458|nr:GSCFA domain-containing protein [Brevundimonas vesicularis]
MPVVRIPADDAFASLRRNRVAAWPDGRKNGKRLEGVAQVAVTPTFSFGLDTPVLTIGSCFARNIERHLQELGFDLPMTKVDIPRDERVSETANDILNKYSVHSIENEIRWAFEGVSIKPEKLFLELEDGFWHDPQLAPNLLPSSFERVKARHDQVMAATRELARCGLVIITLGLAESWFDLETQLYLNGAPPPAALKRYPGRFTLDVLTHDEILDSLERIHALVAKYSNMNAKMLITTSPVPFKATFSGEDALAANCYSKSVQRAACQVFSAAHNDVDYFPSYEVVTLTDRARAYEVDNIHVRPNVVQGIMNSVVKAYCPDVVVEDEVRIEVEEQPKSRDELRRWADKHFKLANYDDAAAGFGALFDQYGHEMTDEERGDVLTSKGVAYLRARRPIEGVSALKAALAETPLDARLHYKLGLGNARLARRDRALVFFDNAFRLAPDAPDHAWRYGEEARRAGLFEQAKALFQKALTLAPDDQRAADGLALVERQSIGA